jgi:hypothetical protein
MVILLRDRAVRGSPVISALFSNWAHNKLVVILFLSILNVKMFATREFLKYKIVLDYAG